MVSYRGRKWGIGKRNCEREWKLWDGKVKTRYHCDGKMKVKEILED